MLPLAHHEGPDRRQPGVLHRPHEQRVHLLSAVLGDEVVAALEVDRVDLVDLDEVGDVEGVVALGARGLEVGVLDLDVCPLRDLVRLDDLVVGYRLALFLADLLVPDRRRVLAVQQVEMQGCSDTAPTMRTGIETRPKEIVPDQIERGIAPVFPTRTFA